MTQDKLTPDAPGLTAEACAWIAQLETGALSTEDLVAFREWVKRSPRHYAEVRRLASLSRDINVIADMAGPLKEVTARRWGVRGAHASAPVRAWGAAALAAFSLCLVAASVFLLRGFGAQPEPYLIATGVGQYREAELSDRSTVNLNTDSQVEVDFDKAQRRIRLLKGEAFFEVAHNSVRPFVVYAGDKQITAVGTAFAVRWTENDLIVTVSEGRVVLGDAPDAGEPPASGDLNAGVAPDSQAHHAFIDAGQRLALPAASANESIEAVSERELTRELSWRSGLLDFEKAPLDEVVREMERYTAIEIEIADEELKQMKFGGIFRIGETDAFFDALELSFGVKVVRVDDRRVRLERAG